MPPDDDLIAADPCPACRTPLTVAVSDLGHLVECPSCGTQFRARRPAPPASPPLRRRDDRPSRGFESDRPFRQYDDEPDDYPRPRPRPRPRFDDEDGDDYDRPRGRKRNGAATAVGVINLVFAGLVLLCGCANVGMSFWLRDLLKNNGPIPNVKPGQIDRELTIMLVAGGVYILGAGLYLAAGLTVVRRAPSGRPLTFLCVGFAVLAVAFHVISFALAAADGDLEDIEPPQLCGAIIAPLIWIGYIITTLILLSKSRDDTRYR